MAENGQMSPAHAEALADHLRRTSVHPPGVVAIAAGELGRYHDFTMALSSLEYPPGTRIHMVRSLSVARNLNIIVNEMPDAAGWCWLQADDHVFEPDSLLRLLARDVDVVVPIIPRRRPPFSTLVFKEETDEGFMAYAWDELPSEGLLGPIYAAGTGGMLVRRSVFERMRDWQGHERYFENTSGDVVNEDTEFCRKLRELDIPIYADVEVVMGHCSMFVACPQQQDGKWGIQFQMGDGPEGALKGIFLQPGERPPGA